MISVDGNGDLLRCTSVWTMLVRADVCSWSSLITGDYFFKVFKEQLVVLLCKFFSERGIALSCLGWYSLGMVLYISTLSCCSRMAFSSAVCEAWH